MEIYNSRNYWSILAEDEDGREHFFESTIVEIIEAY